MDGTPLPCGNEYKNRTIPRGVPKTPVALLPADIHPVGLMQQGSGRLVMAAQALHQVTDQSNGLIGGCRVTGEFTHPDPNLADEIAEPIMFDL